MDIDSIQQLMMISHDSFANIKEEDDVISSIILNEYGTQPETSSIQEYVLESILPLSNELHSLLPHEIDSQPIVQILMAEKVVKTTIIPGRELNISKFLSQAMIPCSCYKSIRMLFLGSIQISLCTHRIYISPDYKPIRQTQRRINPTLRDIVKNELQKLLNAGFIYPISDIQWVSPLVIVPKKGGKW